MTTLEDQARVCGRRHLPLDDGCADSGPLADGAAWEGVATADVEHTNHYGAESRST